MMGEWIIALWKSNIDIKAQNGDSMRIDPLSRPADIARCAAATPRDLPNPVMTAFSIHY